MATALPGFGTFTLTPIAEDIVASGIPDTMTVTIDSAAIDGGTGGGGTSTTLKPGVVLGRNTSAANYSDFDQDAVNGEQLEQRSVILMEEIDLSGGNDTPARVAVNGVFVWTKLRWATTGDRDNYTVENSPFQFTDYPTS